MAAPSYGQRRRVGKARVRCPAGSVPQIQKTTPRAVPGGFSDGLPVGVQVLANPFDEASLFRVAYAYEQATDWRKSFPPL